MSDFLQFDCGCRWPIVGPPPAPGALPLIDVDDEQLPFCSKTWDLLATGQTKGVFQLEKSLGQTWCKKMKPTSANDMGALGALLRPGCLRTKTPDGITTTELYVLRKHGQKEVTPYHPVVDSVLAPTFGLLLFQEQAMLLAQRVAGFNLQDADSLRKAIGKKLAEEMAKCERMFIEGAEKAKIVSREQAVEIFGWIKSSQRYSFNRCVHKNTRIRRLNGGRYSSNTPFTVEEMYRIRNYLSYAKFTGHEQLRKKWKRLGNYGKGLSLCEDGRVRPNTICDITYAGKREVYRVTLQGGRSILVTDNHKFPTTNGIITVADMTSRGEPIWLYICGEYEETDFGPITRFSNMTREEVMSQREGKAVAGCFGSNNVAYTNGSYTDFITNKAKLDMRCYTCNKTKGRLEVHHRDKNRQDSSLDNLIRLCPSCHKKADYQLGRTKRGEKGYPTLTEQVASIVLECVDDVYDVTMDAPNHTFVTDSNIITCNSHAVSYGLLGYDTAYMKAHFPVQFFANWLYFAKRKADSKAEVAELVADSRCFDIPVFSPSLPLLRSRITTNGVDIRFGLCDVREVGGGQFEKLKQAVHEAERELGRKIDQFTWEDYLCHVSHRVDSTVNRNLIMAGTMSCFGKSRNRMLNEYAAWRSLTEKEQQWCRKNRSGVLFPGLPVLLRQLAQPKKHGGGCSNVSRIEKVLGQVYLLENPPTNEADNPNWIAGVEEHTLGIALSCSRVDAVDISMANCTCREFRAGRVGYLLLAVEILGVRELRTKKGRNPGQKMCYLSVSDSGGSLDDVVVFPEAYKLYSSLLRKGMVVLLEGERDKKTGGFVVNHVSAL